MLLVVPFFTSYDVTEGFDLQIYFKSTSTKECKCHYKTRQKFELQSKAKWYYKVAQWASDVLWTSNGHLYEVRSPKDVRYPLEVQVLQSRVIFITKWDNNYKVVQYREQMKETGEIDFGNLLFHSTLICLVTDTYRD